MGSWQGEGHGQLAGGRAWTVCRGKDMDSLQGVWQKRRGGVFEGEGLIPQCTHSETFYMVK